ncbi:MAG: twitch domain-containing radical SAM protein [Bdellovibrionota bacterium]
MSETTPETFCILPWINLEVRADGRVAPCCLNTQVVPHANGSGDYYLYKDSIEEAYASPHLNRLRQNLKSGIKDKSCERCWVSEANGIESKRQRENIHHQGEVKEILGAPERSRQPKRVDIKLGTFCNLKCRICCPSSSSKWTEEFVGMYGEDLIPRENDELKKLTADESRARIASWVDKGAGFWTSMEKWLPEMKGFEFFGGEPFLNRRHFELLKKSVDEGHAAHQSLHYNTNGTVYPTEAVETIFPHFQRLTIFFSIDGLGAQFEYQRKGAQWDKVVENIEKIRANTKAYVGIGITVGVFNIYYLPEFLDYWLAKKTPVFLNLVFSPDHFDVRAMPPELKRRVAEKLRRVDSTRYESILLTSFEGVISFMLSEDRSQYWPDFLTSVRRHDQYRGDSFSATFPEFHALIEDAARPPLAGPIPPARPRKWNSYGKSLKAAVRKVFAFERQP